MMIGGLIALVAVDHRLGWIDLPQPWLQALCLGRTQLPPGLLMGLGFSALIVLAGGELCRMFQANGINADPLMLTVGAVVVCAGFYLTPPDLGTETILTVYGAGLMGWFIIALARYSWCRGVQGAVAAASATLCCGLYLGMAPGFYLVIRRWHSPWVVIGVILIAKSCDIGAYFGGRVLGRHKLIPWLSPGKTWEGLAIGVTTSALVCLLIITMSNGSNLAGQWQVLAGESRRWGPQAYPWVYAFIAGALLGAVGQLGDLVMSLFKRDAGIKDSGCAVPGFGGLLDVLDSPILVAPVGYWLLKAAGTMG